MMFKVKCYNEFNKKNELFKIIGTGVTTAVFTAICTFIVSYVITSMSNDFNTKNQNELLKNQNRPLLSFDGKYSFKDWNYNGLISEPLENKIDDNANITIQGMTDDYVEFKNEKGILRNIFQFDFEIKNTGIGLAKNINFYDLHLNSANKEIELTDYYLKNNYGDYNTNQHSTYSYIVESNSIVKIRLLLSSITKDSIDDFDDNYNFLLIYRDINDNIYHAIINIELKIENGKKETELNYCNFGTREYERIGYKLYCKNKSFVKLIEHIIELDSNGDMNSSDDEYKKLERLNENFNQKYKDLEKIYSKIKDAV